MTSSPESWLLIIHQLPPRPDYLRVKMARRLQRAGAVALKNSAYLLPDDPECRERLDWLREEIVADGGQAWVCRATFLAGEASAGIVERFRSSRREDYAEVLRDLDQLAERARGAPTPSIASDVARLRRRVAAIRAIDYFDASGELQLDATFDRVERMAAVDRPGVNHGTAVDRSAYQGRLWVTRPNVFVDRMASAWLIRRFVDPEATFAFVADVEAAPANAVVFDTPGGTFSHEGDHCTFEVLRTRFGLRDHAVGALAEIVHDIDCRDEKFGRTESAGLERLLTGVRARGPSDADRLQRSAAILDDLYLSLGGT